MKLFKKEISDVSDMKTLQTPFQWDVTESSECLRACGCTQITTLYFTLYVKLCNPVHEMPFWKAESENFEKGKVESDI